MIFCPLKYLGFTISTTIDYPAATNIKQLEQKKSKSKKNSRDKILLQHFSQISSITV